MNRTDFGVLFREPKFPVIGYADDCLFFAVEIRGLASIFVGLERSLGKDNA